MRPKRVLIADPDESITIVYRRYLVDAGYKVDSSTDAVDCIERLKSFVPDVLVLDPRLPWGGGDGVLEVMYNEEDVPVVPVLVLASGEDLESLYRVAAYPVSEWRDKPCWPTNLELSIRFLVDRPALPNPPRSRLSGIGRQPAAAIH